MFIRIKTHKEEISLGHQEAWLDAHSVFANSNLL